MILHVHSDESYLSEPHSKSRSGGHFYFSTPNNFQSPIYTESSIIKRVVTSSSEAEISAMYINTHQILHIRNILNFLHPPQQATPLITDRKVGHGILKNIMNPCKTKHMAMSHHWLKEKHENRIICIEWKPGTTNKADYSTKHHSTKHHIISRPNYVINNLSYMQGCVRIRPITSCRPITSHRTNTKII